MWVFSIKYTSTVFPGLSSKTWAKRSLRLTDRTPGFNRKHVTWRNRSWTSFSICILRTFDIFCTFFYMISVNTSISFISVSGTQWQWGSSSLYSNTLTVFSFESLLVAWNIKLGYLCTNHLSQQITAAAKPLSETRRIYLRLISCQTDAS